VSDLGVLKQAQTRYWVVVPAAGVGKRMQADRPKQYLDLLGKTVIEHTLERLLAHPDIEGVVVALAENDNYWAQLAIAGESRIQVVAGGIERHHSVINGLARLLEIGLDDAWVMVHDAARPCISGDDIDCLIAAVADGASGVVLGVPVRDTMKQVDALARVEITVDRPRLWHAFTPQMFRLSQLYGAIKACEEKGLMVTDEASAMEQCGVQPTMVEGRYTNIKITRHADLAMAAFLLGEGG